MPILLPTPFFSHGMDSKDFKEKQNDFRRIAIGSDHGGWELKEDWDTTKFFHKVCKWMKETPEEERLPNDVESC